MSSLSNLQKNLEDVGLEEKFPIPNKEPEKKTENGLSMRIRQYFILELIIILLLSALMHNSYQNSSRNMKVYESMTKLQNQMDYYEKQNGKSLTQESHSQLESSTVVSNLSKKLNSSEKSASCPLKIINAASYMRGARVKNNDTGHSDQYVIFERPNPPKNSVWCSEEKSPNLTIRLTEYIHPLYVSYQHSKWYGKVPDGAPKVFDVVACFDVDCNTWEPLVSNCQYQSDNQEQEQKCNISHNSSLFPFEFVQFQFRENYGNVKETCANLVRVYGNLKGPIIDKKKQEENKETCSSLKWDHHNLGILYTVKHKNCSRLYSLGCCEECPECCDECLIDDLTAMKVILILVGLCIIFAVVFVIGLAAFLIPLMLVAYCQEKLKKRNEVDSDSSSTITSFS
ncbi:unnamed protein product [Caenorhabditis brenneri]